MIVTTNDDFSCELGDVVQEKHFLTPLADDVTYLLNDPGWSRKRKRGLALGSR
jgi:hypothetical protein